MGRIADVPIAELASALVVGTLRVVDRLAVQEVRVRNAPAARGRIVSLGRPARVGNTDGCGRGRSSRFRAQPVEVGVATRSNILGLEIAVNDRHLKARVAGVRGQFARLSVRLRLGGTGEPALYLAGAGAAVPVILIAIITVLARINIAIAACRRASLVVARAVMTTRLLGAGLRAARSVPIEEAILARATLRRVRRIGSAVALLVLLWDSVSANRLGTGAWPVWAGGARLYLAGARTAVAVIGIAVVAGLSSLLLVVTANRGARLSWHATLEAFFNGIAVS